MLQVRNIEWIAENTAPPRTGAGALGFLRLLDQTRLPTEVAYIDCHEVADVWQAIRRLAVRGVPAIGIAAAYGCVLAVQAPRKFDEREQSLLQAAEYLATSRPTAVNLFWALERMKRVQPRTPEALLHEAQRIHQEDAAMCRRIGEFGLSRLQRHFNTQPATGHTHPGAGAGVLTHCNAGALATGGIGTATAPMYLAHEQGLPLRIFVDETRPLLQAARLTAYELAAAGLDVTLICDDMAAHVMRQGRVSCVITGADRIAANGDTANKIGTYNLAVLARHHGLPFFIAAPSTTFDLTLADGSLIPIEERAGEEITAGFGKRTAPPPPEVKTYNPAFDVTPHDLITAIITERGVIEPVNAQQVRQTLASRTADFGADRQLK